MEAQASSKTAVIELSESLCAHQWSQGSDYKFYKYGFNGDQMILLRKTLIEGNHEKFTIDSTLIGSIVCDEWLNAYYG